jgi:SHS2 domain-containing protein
MGYEIIEHPADIGFRVSGTSLEGAFGEAALALFSLMATGQGGETAEHTIRVTAEDLDALLYDFLEELLILFETEAFFGTSASVAIRRGGRDCTLDASIRGFTMSGTGWKPAYDVKAITYHQMLIEERPDGCTIRVFVDI